MSNLVPFRSPAAPQVKLLVEDTVDLTFVADASDRELAATIEADIEAAEDLKGHIFRHVFRAAACLEELYRRECVRAAARGEKLHRRGWLSGKFSELLPGVSKTTYYQYRKIASPNNRELLQEYLELVQQKAALSQSPQEIEPVSGSAGQIDTTQISARPSIRGFNRYIDLKRAHDRPKKVTRRPKRSRKTTKPQHALASAISGLRLDEEVTAMLVDLIQAEVQYDRLLPPLPANSPLRKQLLDSRQRIRDEIAAFAELLDRAAESPQEAAERPAAVSAEDFYA